MSGQAGEGGVNLLRLFLNRSRRSVGLAVLAGIASGGATALLIAVINHWLKAGASHSPNLLWAFAALCLLRLVSGIACHVLLIRLSQGAIRDLRLKLCQSILASPLRQVETTGNHRLVAAFTEDMTAIANVIVNLPYLFVNIIILAACLVYLGWLSWAMLGGVAVCLALGAITYLLPVVWANRRLRWARREQDRLFGHFRSVTEGIKQLKLHRRRQREFLDRELLPAADAVRGHNVAGIAIYSAAANWNRLLFFLYVGLLLLAAPYLFPRQPASLAGYVLVLLYMMAPLEAIMNALPHAAQANVALRHIAALDLSLQSAGQEDGRQRLDADSSTVAEASPSAVLEAENLSYTYHDHTTDRPFTLGPLDLTLRVGELLFVAGGNGSGKTTLAKLLCGLYVPDDGQLCVDGQRIEEHNRESYRQLFTVLFSDFHLFDNLLGLDLAALDQRAHQYLIQLQLDHKLSIESGRLSTTALSQGQRKRLALLVALLEDRPVYIFDEWAADQDPQFKSVFYDRILPDLKARGKAVLVITHDDRYFDRADRLVKLEDGKLMEPERTLTSTEEPAMCVRA